MHSHGPLKRVRKKRKRSRKLSENRELLATVIVMVFCGLALVGLLTYVLSTRSCQAPKVFKSQVRAPSEPSALVEGSLDKKSGSTRSRQMH